MIGKHGAIELLRQHVGQALDALDRKEWYKAVEQAKEFASKKGLYDDLYYPDVLRVCREEQEARIPPEERAAAVSESADMGFVIKGIKQIGDEYEMDLDIGKLNVSVDTLARPKELRNQIIAQLRVYVRPIKPNVWESVLEKVVPLIENHTVITTETETITTIETALDDMMNEATERDIAFLSKAIPVLVGGKLHFRINDFLKRVASYNRSIKSPAIYAVLREKGYEPGRTETLRFWKET